MGKINLNDISDQRDASALHDEVCNFFIVVLMNDDMLEVLTLSLLAINIRKSKGKNIILCFEIFC